jgi:hypothetical protein
MGRESAESVEYITTSPEIDLIGQPPPPVHTHGHGHGHGHGATQQPVAQRREIPNPAGEWWA